MNDWIELLVTYEETEAHIVKGILESENIHSEIDSLRITPYPVSIGRIGEIRVLVHKDDEERARQLLRDFEAKNTMETDDN